MNVAKKNKMARAVGEVILFSCQNEGNKKKNGSL